jgi:WD40 repeat protein
LLALAPDGFLAVIYRSSNTFEVHDIETRHLIQAIPGDAQSDLVPQPVAFTHDGFAIVTGGKGKAFLWDIEHGDKLQVLDHGGKQLSGSGQLLAHSLCFNFRFMLYQHPYSKLIHALWLPVVDPRSQTYFSDVADRFIIVTGMNEGKNSRIVLWDTASLLANHGNGKFNTCYAANGAGSAQMDTTDEKPSGNWLIWSFFGMAALLLSWRWMGYL